MDDLEIIILDVLEDLSINPQLGNPDKLFDEVVKIAKCSRNDFDKTLLNLKNGGEINAEAPFSSDGKGPRVVRIISVY